MEKPHDLAVGEAVFYAREQAVGIIYETYSFVDGPDARPGVSLLLSDGRNLGGFNAQEADQFLLPLGPTDLDYRFTDVGQLAAEIRAVRPPEPYKGKGIRYADEKITIKETKKK